MESSAPFTIRPARPEDASFILATWQENFWRESPWGHRLTARVFFGGHHPILIRILSRASVLVACDPGDPDSIAGYFVFEPGIAHWAYVKKAMRRFGVARALLVASGLPPDLAGVRVTHPTRMWFTTKAHGPGLEALFPLAIHDPYSAFTTPGVTA